MPSSNKTDYLKLNRWLNNDELQIQDWIDDNEKIDAEFLDRGVNVKWFGAKGDGVADDTTAIQNAFNNSMNNKVYIPDGTFNISQELTLPIGVTLEMSTKATLKAIAVINSIITTPTNNPHINGFIKGGILDCNGLANIGLNPAYFERFTIENTVVENPAQTHFKIGSSLSTKSSYEAFIKNVKGHRNSGIIAPVGSIGLLTENCSDSKFIESVFVGAETGVKLNGSNHFLDKIHCWNRPSNSLSGNGGLKTAFEIVWGNNVLQDCYADTPIELGYWNKGDNNVFISCKVYNNNSYGTDNIITGFKNEGSGTYSTYISPIAYGQDNSHRILRDFDGVLTSTNIIGPRLSNVTNGTKPRIIDNLQLVNRVNALTGLTANDTIDLDISTDTNRRIWIKKDGINRWALAFDNGLSFKAFDDSGNYINEYLFINRTTGQVQIINSQLKLSGSWQNAIILGTNSLWVSADGKLRIKNGTPSSDTDGTVVGTQA